MRPVPVLLLSLSALASPALANDAERSGDEILVTAQKANQTQVSRDGNLGVLGAVAASDAAFNLRSYNAALILNQQPQTLGQLLENDPSVRTTYGFGNAAEQFVIRGFTLYGDDVGLDGLYGITPRQLVAPELYESVQVLNGASAFLNGAAPGGSGIGGSVNLIPKRAGAVPLTRLTANFTGDAHVGGSFDVSRRIGNIGIRINGAGRRGDVAVDGEFRSSYVLGGAIDWQGERARLSLDLGWQRVHVGQLRPKVTIASAGIPRVPRAAANYSQPWAYTTLRDVFGMVKGEYDLSDAATLYASFGARDGSEKGVYVGFRVTDALTGDGSSSGFYVRRTDNNEAAQAGIRVTLAGAGLTHKISIGGSAAWQVNRNAYDFLGSFSGFETNLYAPVVVDQPASFFPGGNLDSPFPISRTRLTSVFASDTIGAFDDRLLLTVGLRLQKIRQKSYAYSGGGLVSDYNEDATTPVIGLVVKPVDGVSLYANRIEGMQQGPSAPIDPSLVNPGEVFAPTKSVQYETGVKLALGRLNASLALFRTDLPSAFAMPVDAADPSGPQRYGRYGEQRNRGIEFGLDGEPVDGLRLIAGVSINDAKLRRTAGGVNEGNEVAGIPDYLANANVEWDLPFLPALTLTGRIVRTGGQQVNAANTLSIPGWTRFDLGGRYVALVSGRPVTFRAMVDNVANKRYWASAFDAFAPALLQGTPRTVKLSVSVDF